MYLELDGRGERYRQLLRALKQAILDGRLQPGFRLPSTRELANDLRLSRNTVVAAYELLCAERLAGSRRGSGTYVAAEPIGPSPPRPAEASVAPPSRYAARLRELPPLRPGRHGPDVPIDLQPGEPLTNLALLNAWRLCLSQAATRTAPGYPPPQGLPALRRQVAAHVALRRGVRCEADDVVIVNGTQQALALIVRVVADEGDTVVVEEPGYELTTRCLLAHGAVVRPVPVDDDGLDVSRLPAGRLRLVVVTPAHQFPTGATMSLPRRLELLRQATRRNFWIFEDDYDGEFAFENRMLPALRSLDDDGRVTYVGTFSKTVFPALRLGYVVAPRALRADLVRAKLYSDIACSALEQAAMARFMETGGFDRHLRATARELRRRRRALLAGLHAHCARFAEVRDSGGGMHCAVRLPGFDAGAMSKLVELARERGLGLHPVEPAGSGPQDACTLLLGFAGVSARQLTRGVRVLGECLARVAPSAPAKAARPRARAA